MLGKEVGITGLKGRSMTIIKLKHTLLILLVMSNFITGKTAFSADNSYRNAIGMEFVQIAAGSFFMGSDLTLPQGRANETPRHTVRISKPFYLGRNEVTQAQWEAVMGQNPYSMHLTYGSRWDYLLDQPGRFISPEKPATVSWEDAQEFIKRLNALEGSTVYRLPTEAEWEYACRAGSDTLYTFGDDIAELEEFAWYGGDFASGSTHEVGTKRPNAWGLYDMHGNVWEWVQDYYNANYYSLSPEVDPPGPTSGSSRVVRGGSWHSSAGAWHSAFRKEYPEDYRGISIGFRLVYNPVTRESL